MWEKKKGEFPQLFKPGPGIWISQKLAREIVFGTVRLRLNRCSKGYCAHVMRAHLASLDTNMENYKVCLYCVMVEFMR